MRKNNVALIVSIVVVALCLLVIIPMGMAISSIADDIDAFACEHEDVEKRVKEIETKFHIVDSFCADCGTLIEEEIVELHEWDANSVCKVCDYTCKHDYFEIFVSMDDAKHTRYIECLVCGKNHEIVEAHSYKDKTCTVCSYTCKHSGAVVTSATSVDDGFHIETIVCACGYTLTHENNHTYNNTDTCKVCEHVCPHPSALAGACVVCGTPLTDPEDCSHPEMNCFVTYVEEDNSYHTKNWRCGACGDTETFVTMPHSYNDNSVCTDCGRVCDHSCGGVAGYCALCTAELQ